MLEAIEALGGVPVSAVVLVLARSIGLVWALAWLIGASGAGMRARVAISAVLAAAVLPMVGPALIPPSDPIAIGARVVFEATAGVALGLGAGLIVAAARLAGEVIGIQSGLAAAATLDPDAGAGSGAGGGGATTPLATLSGLIALATFAALDGPFHLLVAMANSYRLGIPGRSTDLAGASGSGLVTSAFAAVGDATALALRLAAPAALALLTAQVALGLLARTLSAPVAWLPMRMALGLLLILIGLPGLVIALSSAWSAVLGGG